MQKYSRTMVVLHWLLAALVIGALMMGGGIMSDMPNDDPEKLTALRAHMSVGILIFALMVVRLIVRLRSTLPPEVDTGVPALNGVARPVHLAIYAITIAMALSGMALSQQAGLPAIVFGGQGALPDSFADFTARAVHGWIALGLMILIGVHLAGVFYHQIFRDSGVIGRMT